VLNAYSSTPERLFNLYSQVLVCASLLPFSSQSKEFCRDFVTSGLRALFLFVISKFLLQNGIFHYKTLGFGD